MTYVRDMKSAELMAHMRKLQAMPGWSDPLADSLFRELEDTELRRQSLWNACSEWAEKTDWARPFEPKELGKHIGDVIKDRFDALKAESLRLTMFNTAYADTITRLNGVIKLEKEQNEALRKDAERYRWLRAQHWDSSAICCVVDPKVTTKLGAYCPSLDLLDQAVDAGIKLGKEAGNG